jgi:phosphate-selective porin
VPEGRNHLKGESAFGYSIFGRTAYVNGRRLRQGVDVVWMPGSFSVKAEYLRVREARTGMGVGNETTLDNDLPDLSSDGRYASGSGVITGEKKASGVVPRRRFGAIEVAGRYDVVRFGGGNTAEEPSDGPRAANVAGNEDRTATVGVNWYFGRNVKVQVNGIREEIRDVTRAPLVGRTPTWSAVCRLQFAM